MVSDGSVIAGTGKISAEARLSGSSTIDSQALVAPEEGTNLPLAQRESGDQVNRFLLCSLIAESAKQIKARANRAGEALPMAQIVRGVMRSYRLAAKDKNGPLSQTELDMPGLRKLNDKILKDEIMRHSRARVKNSETRLAHAERLGDNTRIKSEQESLDRAIELRDQLANKR
ncbi:MAG TPA: hypothetical protein VNH22_06220 [Blastocatellia bacterium]|jgi:hypothetical protein|nr:hypothetical protein [Blastocatellia bacterium]